MAATSSAPSTTVPTRGRLARLVRIQYRLLTFALARLRYRRTLALLVAGGTAITLAMLTVTLVLQTAVEDRTFADAVRTRGERGIYFGARISADAPSLRARVTDEIARHHLPFRSTALIMTGDHSFVVLTGSVASDFVVDSGRLPRPCTPRRCEYVSAAPTSRGGAVIADVSGGPLELPGFRPVKVGHVLKKEGSVVPYPPAQRLVVVSGFSLLRKRYVSVGYGELVWSAPASRLVEHPWNVPGATRRIAHLRADLARLAPNLLVDTHFEQLDEPLREAATAGRRLLIVSGAMIGVFLAFLVFAATRLRNDAELLRERLLIANASRSQIRFLTFFEYLIATSVGAVAGALVGLIAGAALAQRIAGAGVDSALHVAASGHTWLYWATAAAAALAIFLLVVWLRVVGLRGRSLPLAELAAVVGGAVLVAGFLNGGFDSSRLAEANAGVLAFVTVAPALAVTVVAVAGARLFRPALLLFARLAERMGAMTRLAALSIARRPGDAAVLVAFVGATLGLALFLHAYRATLIQSQHDQVLYAAPTDFVVSEDLTTLVAVNSVPSDRFPGVPKIEVMRAAGDIPQLANGGFTLLGIPAEQLGVLDGWRNDFSDVGLPELARRLKPAANVAFRGLPLPPTRVLTIPIRTTGEPLEIAATLLSRSGDFTEISVGTTHEAALRLAVPSGFRGGKLVGFSFRPGDTGLFENPNAGEFVDDVAVGSLLLGPVDWADFRGFRGINGVDVRASRHLVRMRYAVGTDAVGRLRMKQPTDGRLVNVVVSPQLAKAAGARGVLPIDVLGTGVAARVVGVVRHFPTVHGNVVVADRQWVATALNANDPGPPFYNEIWLNAEHPQQVAQELRRPPFVDMKVDSRTAVTDASESASMVRAARDLFLVAAIAAVALAVLGMALAATSDVRARRWEILDLRGQGADQQWIARFVRRRLVVSCAFAGVLAAVAGLALLFATVSLLRIAADFRQADPPVRMSLPWVAIAGSALAVAAVATVLVTALVRSQLRELGGART